ncbi:hypothetical protein F5Y03DRAFT_33858 [Xylaria venustula]|nr:hypothetical protein F5Y03DRAFT_33858 [Xylaria venustula]
MRRLPSNRGIQAYQTLTTHQRYTKHAPHTFYSNINRSGIKTVTVTDGTIDVETFRSIAWEPSIPVHLRNFHRLPAIQNWIDSQTQKQAVSFGGKLKEYAQTDVNYEVMMESGGDSSGCSLASMKQFAAWRDAGSEDRLLAALLTERSVAALSDHGVDENENENQHPHFIQFVAPLSFILNASKYNTTQTEPSQRIKELYVAQSDIRSLPPALAEDVPIPEIVSNVGKGDIYGSSIWLGLQPTYTPLHRDPNPNLFCQLIGSKIVRLMQHGAGLSVFQGVRRQLGRAGNSRFRGPGMMEGPERERLHHAVWVEPDTSRDIWEARLEPGDALFIPTGWWHSVRSVGRDAELNASANWWFR